MTDRQIPEEKRETPSEPVPGTTGQTVRSASREPVFGDNARKRTGEGDSADGQNGGASGQTVREKRTPKSGSTERRVDLSAAGTAGEPSGEGGEKEKKAEEAPEEAGRRKRRRRREKEERAAVDGDLRTGEKRKIKEKSAGGSDEQDKTSENGEAGKGGARGGFRDSWKISVAVTAFLMAVSILVTFQVTFLVLREKYQRTLDGMRLAESDLAKLSQVQSLFEREYVGEVNKTAVLDALLKSYVRAAGDKYSEYYTAEEYEALQSVQRGEAVGIGVIVTEDETGIRVQWVSEGSPPKKRACRWAISSWRWTAREKKRTATRRWWMRSGARSGARWSWISAVPQRAARSRWF